MVRARYKVLKLLHVIACPRRPISTERRMVTRLEHPHQELKPPQREEGSEIAFVRACEGPDRAVASQERST